MLRLSCQILVVTPLLCGLAFAAPKAKGKTTTVVARAAVWQAPAGKLRHKLKKVGLTKPGMLIHQAEDGLPKVGRSAARWPAALRDSVTWTAIGHPSWDYGPRRNLAQYAYKLERGWRLLPIEMLYSEEMSALVKTWRSQYRGAPPRNAFSQRLRESIEADLDTLATRNNLWDEGERGIPQHADFYRSFGIAGFYGRDYGNTHAFDDVAILLPLGSSVRLKRDAR